MKCFEKHAISFLALGSKRKKEDTFGMNDEDWNVYKQIVSKLFPSISIPITDFSLVWHCTGCCSCKLVLGCLLTLEHGGRWHRLGGRSRPTRGDWIIPSRLWSRLQEVGPSIPNIIWPCFACKLFLSRITVNLVVFHCKVVCNLCFCL